MNADQPDRVEEPSPGDLTDELPEELDRGFVGPYTFPDNSRRRIPGLIYLVIGSACLVLWALAGDDGVLVNDGVGIAGVGLGLFGVYHLVAGSRLGLDENEALVAATRHVDFAVGHASAQLGWRGLLSRPTWRILLFSAEDPPARRGLVLVDARDGRIVDGLVEDNPDASWGGGDDEAA